MNQTAVLKQWQDVNLTAICAEQLDVEVVLMDFHLHRPVEG